MAFVRSPRGAKSRFSVARISNRISRAYVDALGARAADHRRSIQGHAKAVTAFLRSRLGDGDGVEWARTAIRSAIEEELRAKAPTAVHESYLESQKPERDREEAARLRAEQWSRFEAMGLPNPDRIDPVWSIAEDPVPPVAGGGSSRPLENLGTLARASKSSSIKTSPQAAREPVRRSDWLAFWQGLATRVDPNLDFDVLEKQVLRMAPNLRHLDPSGWWVFWQEQLDVAMRTDPRMVGLLRAAQERRDRARVVGRHWLAGSGLESQGRPLGLGFDPAGDTLYRDLWEEYALTWLRDETMSSALRRFDIRRLADRLRPERDALIDWRGAHWLSTAECLWNLDRGPWQAAAGAQHLPDAQELPQWAWMRTAMALAADENDPMEQALTFYEAFSTLSVVPSETMLREAGKRVPRYLEDEAGVVGDRFESIHQAIHRAAIGTKWTGTMALDWRQVRAQGATIAGRRLSQGPVGFMRSIHSSLAAQGREGDDRPVTVTLPLWHRDVESFWGDDRAGLGRLQCVVSIPDLFFQRLQDGGDWTLMDPACFPELGEGDAVSYAAAEARWRAAPKGSALAGAARRIAADRLWRRLTQAMRQGNPFVTFEGSDRAFAPFPTTAPPIGGIDGVGAIPVPRNSDAPFVAWPAAAVDLSRTLGPEGNPDPERMRVTAAVALRVLDNAISLSDLPEDSPTRYYRPVCLGAVGFFEAVNRSSAHSQNDPELTTAWVSGLAEAWAAVVLLADQGLRQERGAAPAWGDAPDGRPFDPLSAMGRLREARGGSLGHKPRPRQEWSAHKFREGHRCSVRTVWAPFQGAARIAGVTPGGMGTLRPVERLVDEQGLTRWSPTPLLLQLVEQRPEELDVLREVMRHPTEPSHWPAFLVQLVHPSPEGWERRLLHAANIRPWIDQGVSLTLPAGMDPDAVRTLVRRAWWLGLSNVRFEGLPSDPSLPVRMENVGEPG